MTVGTVPTIVAVASRKGGSTKSTTAVYLAACFARMGRRVVVVDMDAQASVSRWINPGRHREGGPLADALRGGGGLPELARPSSLDGVQVIPSGREVGDAEQDLDADRVGLLKAQKAIQSAKGCGADLVLLDTPGTAGVLAWAGIAAADHVVVPCPCQPGAVGVLQETLHIVKQVREHVPGTVVELAAVLPTMLDRRTRFSVEQLEFLRDKLGDLVTSSVITYRSAIAESMGTTGVAHPSSEGFREYLEAAAELERRMDGTTPATAPDVASVMTHGQNQEGAAEA